MAEDMDVFTAEHAQQLDEADPLRHLCSSFIVPTKGELTRNTLAPQTAVRSGTDDPSIYLCGNSLGLQPTLTRQYMQDYLDTWASKGVYGHFKPIDDSSLPPWIHVDDDVRPQMAALVGALPSEVAMMQTLTANLHLMMTSFYLPTKERYKIILEGKAFPSDHYAVESQIRQHGLDPRNAMVLIEPPNPAVPYLSTKQIISVIDDNAADTALLLLPGVQYYTGQYFDIGTITAHARNRGIVVGWDLAHAVGNVPLQLHEWSVDFACWCTYKYLNSGPGAVGGCFVHERHGVVDGAGGPGGSLRYRPRLTGWWGSSKASRFQMTNEFEPIPGAPGYQLSNPSVADTTALRASLDVFQQTSMADLRQKSLLLTKYLEDLLDILAQRLAVSHSEAVFTVITPRNPAERGAQLSVLLKAGLLDNVMQSLEERGVVVDERRPDVIRVAPAPLYNTFSDVLKFAEAFETALASALKRGKAVRGDVAVMT